MNALGDWGEALPLSGVRVVDLTFNISGPYATLILGDLGADVIKVERPGGGDDSRRMTPVYGHGSAYFFAINRNKRSVTLDVRDRRDRAALVDVLSEADVFVTNLRPSKLSEVELDFEAVHQRFPRLLYADISGYGNQGEERDRPGYDMVLQARSGLMSVTGEEGRPPVRVGVSILDMGTGIWLALGILAALRLRDRTGLGGQVSTSLLEVGLGFMAYDIAAYQMTGEIPGPRGSGHPAFGPYGAYLAKDGYLALGVGADHIFERLANAVGRSDWTEDERYRTNASRVRNSERLKRELEQALGARPVREWVQILTRAGVPAEPVGDVSQLPVDEQLAAIDSWLEVPVDDGGKERTTLRLPGLPVRLSRRRPPVRLAPPRPGAHSDAVLRPIGERGANPGGLGRR